MKTPGTLKHCHWKKTQVIVTSDNFQSETKMYTTHTFVIDVSDTIVTGEEDGEEATVFYV